MHNPDPKNNHYVIPDTPRERQKWFEECFLATVNAHMANLRSLFPHFPKENQQPVFSTITDD